MSWTTASGFRTITKTLVAGAFIAIVAIGVSVPANAQGPTGPSDPACIQQPTNPTCAGGPYAPPTPAPPAPPGPPTGPDDPACMSNPADAACVGSPFLPPPPPPVAPIDAGLPFDTFTGGPHIDDMMPIDDTAAAMPHLGGMGRGMGGPHIGGMGMGGAHIGGMGGAGHA